MVRILLADDHDVVRRGLHEIIAARPDWHICGEAKNGREAVKLAIKLNPDIVVMDLSMPELNGLEAVRQISKELPETEILVYTMHDTDKMIRDVLAAGAHGYLLKSDAVLQIVTAIESLSQHKPYFTDKVSKALLDAYLNLKSAQNIDESDINPLTDREREIVQLLAEGRSNKEIATRLSISDKTVEKHRASIMRKLEINSIVELVHYAIRNKIVEP